MRKLWMLFLLVPAIGWAIPPTEVPTPILSDKGVHNKDYTHVTAQELTLLKWGSSVDVLDVPQNSQACVNANYTVNVLREADLCRCVLYAMTDGTVGNPIYELRMRCPNGVDHVVYTNGVR